MKFLEWIKSLFTDTTYQDSVEQYVVSKNPKTTCEVEYWIRRYDQGINKGWVL
jgi:hypothetical protein